jgi:hypothetical protein
MNSGAQCCDEGMTDTFIKRELPRFAFVSEMTAALCGLVQEPPMATQPEPPPPDTIEPQSPPETPADPSPAEAPFQEPPEVAPPQPDIDFPDRGMPETPPPPD